MAQFQIERFWRVILDSLQLSPEVIAQRAGLPVGIFTSDAVMVDVEAWAALWDALEAEVDSPELPLQLSRLVTLDMFDPALFAALCSENLRQAATRLQRYKRLMGPCRLQIIDDDGFAIGCQVEGLPTPPRLWGIAELVIWVALVRHLTRSQIKPMQVVAPVAVAAPKALASFFGVPVTRGPTYRVTFKAEDAKRRFVTTDSSMWAFFEPALESRLAECNAHTSMRECVSAALVELLPSGRTELGDVAAAIGLSIRTIQRRLGAEGQTFREVLDATRAKLATHYLTRTDLTAAEVAFLIGYEDPNSFYPAFRCWTGMTPQAARNLNKTVS